MFGVLISTCLYVIFVASLYNCNSCCYYWHCYFAV